MRQVGRLKCHVPHPFGERIFFWKGGGMVEEKRDEEENGPKPDIGDVPVGVAWQVLFLKNKETAF